jgi:hypothetical protein
MQRHDTSYPHCQPSSSATRDVACQGMSSLNGVVHWRPEERRDTHLRRRKQRRGRDGKPRKATVTAPETT